VTILSRFRYITIGASARAMAPAVQPGSRYLVDLEPPKQLHRGWIVMWVAGDSAALSRIVAVPGDVVAYDLGVWFVKIPDGSKLRLDAKFPDKLNGRKLVADEYLLLNDVLKVPLPDSRADGVVPRSRIRFHVLFESGASSR